MLIHFDKDTDGASVTHAHTYTHIHHTQLASFDRGERMANFDAGGGQRKDKLPIILQVVEAAAKLCEVGYEVEMYFISAWPASQEESRKQIEEKLFCERIGGQVRLTFRDHFNKTVVGNLASRHRCVYVCVSLCTCLGFHTR